MCSDVSRSCRGLTVERDNDDETQETYRPKSLYKQKKGSMAAQRRDVGGRDILSKTGIRAERVRLHARRQGAHVAGASYTCASIADTASKHEPTTPHADRWRIIGVRSRGVSSGARRVCCTHQSPGAEEGRVPEVHAPIILASDTFASSAGLTLRTSCVRQCLSMARRQGGACGGTRRCKSLPWFAGVPGCMSAASHSRVSMLFHLPAEEKVILDEVACQDADVVRWKSATSAGTSNP